MTTAEDIQELVKRHVVDAVICAPLAGEDGRIGCVVPLDYPSGDEVSVWVEPKGSAFFVTDYGEALADALSRPVQDHKALVEQAEHVARVYGLTFSDERLAGEAGGDALGEMVWRVAAAAAQIAQVSAAFRPRRQRKTKDFVHEVERDFRQHDLAVERERKLEGKSGHEHRATIYLPANEIIVEPVGGGGGNWNQLSTVYTKLSDLAQANGFTPYTLVDDRQQPLEDDFASMLTQVSDVLAWSHRDEWIDSL